MDQTAESPHLISLQARHERLEARIADEYRRPQPDTELVNRLKIEKLHLKEEMQSLMNVYEENIPEAEHNIPRVMAASGILDRELTVCREAGETNARYQSRAKLVELLIQNARSQ